MHKRIGCSRLVVFVSLLTLLMTSASVMSSEKTKLIAKDVETNLQAFRDDKKFTLALIRYHDCELCNEAEVEMQQWFDQADQKLVSALIINTDSADKHEAVRARQSSAGISTLSFFSENAAEFSQAFIEITGTPIMGVPLFVFFGSDGAYIDQHTGEGFDWLTLNEMLAASKSGLFSSNTATPTKPNYETAEVVEFVGIAQQRFSKGDYQRAGQLADWLRENHPDSLLAKIESARHLIRTNKTPNDSNLKYSIEPEAAQEAESLLLSVLEAEPANHVVVSLLAELYTIQQELKKAAAVMGNAGDSYQSSHYAKYNRAMVAFVSNKHAEAMENLTPILEYDNAWYGKSKQKLLAQQAWRLAKRIGYSDHKYDPIPLIKDGLVERVLEDEVLATLEENIPSDIPVMLFINSEDPNCSPCTDISSGIEPFVKGNQDKYQFLYVSIEPWRNIAFQPWTGALFNVKGVPNATIFARGRFLITGGLPNADLAQQYEDNYPKFIAENKNLNLFDFKRRAAKGKVNAAHGLWAAEKRKVSAFASVLTSTNYAWGSYGTDTGTQQEADSSAMKSCRKHAKRKGIKEDCKITGRL